MYLSDEKNSNVIKIEEENLEEIVSKPNADSQLMEEGHSNSNSECIQKCPKCTIDIIKKSDDNLMHCEICEYEFCWICGLEASSQSNSHSHSHYILASFSSCPYLRYTQIQFTYYKVFLLLFIGGVILWPILLLFIALYEAFSKYDDIVQTCCQENLHINFWFVPQIFALCVLTVYAGLLYIFYVIPTWICQLYKFIYFFYRLYKNKVR
jgi:hypothetical protein